MAKKRISVLLILVLLTVSMLGISLPGAQAASAGTEFSVFLMSTAPSTQDPAISAVGQKLAEVTGVNLKLEFLVGTDVRQKASLMIASGELPDMIVTGDSLGDFISAGALVPLNDYIAGAKNIGKVYSDTMIKLMTQPDGNIYNLSTSMPSEDKVYPAAGFYLGMDLLKEKGYPIVRSLEEYKQLLIDYVKAHPEVDGQPTIGFTGPMEGWRASGMQYGASRFLGGYPNDGLTYVDPESLDAKIIMRADFEKAFYKFLNDLNDAGILDKEMFMQTNDQYNAKIASGRVVGLYDQRGMFIDAITALEKISPERMLVAMPVVLDDVETEKYRGPRVFTASGGLSITTSCKDADAAFAFLDECMTEDVQKLLVWGIEGEDYSLADGKFTMSDDQWLKFADVDYRKSRGLNGIYNFLPHMGNLMYFSDGNIYDPAQTDEYANFKLKDYEKEFLSHYEGAVTFNAFFNPSYDAFYEPGWSVRTRIPTDDPRKIAGETALEITREYIPKLATCAPADFDATWDELQSKLNALPLTEYEELATQMLREGSEIYKSESN